MSDQNLETLLDEKELSRLLRVSIGTLRFWRTIERGPRYRNRRNLAFTGDLLRNFQVRTVSENRSKASVSTRKDRIKAWANQKREEWMVFSPKNKAVVVQAARKMLDAMKPCLLVEKLLGGKQR